MSFVPRSSPCSLLRDELRATHPPSGFPTVERISTRLPHSCPCAQRVCTRSTLKLPSEWIRLSTSRTVQLPARWVVFSVHSSRLPAPLCPPRSEPPSRFPKTMYSPSRLPAQPGCPGHELVSCAPLQTLVTQNPSRLATPSDRRLPPARGRLATRLIPGCPDTQRVSQRCSPSGRPSEKPA